VLRFPVLDSPVMSEHEYGHVPDAGDPVRPLAIRRELKPVTRFFLPGEIGTPPPDLLRELQASAETVRRFVLERLLSANAGGEPALLVAIEAIGSAMSAAYEEQLSTQRQRDPELRRRFASVDCRQGCAFCCHVNVTVSVLEAIRIAAALRTQRQDRESAILSAAGALAGLSAADRLAMKAACPLLVDGACSIYDIRPIACRALLSQSAALCERQFDAGVEGADISVPMLVTPRLIAAGFISGEIAAMEDLGLVAHLVELTAALALLLRDPTSLIRWLNGEDVFARA